MGTFESQALWAAIRASNAFLLGVLKLGAGGYDHVDTVLLIAIVQANVAPITMQSELQVRYAGRDASPPDSLRRPVSINGLSASVRMPFETVRRRIRRLAKAGLCEITADGVLVPRRAMELQSHDQRLSTNYELVRRLYLRLRAAELLQGIPQLNASDGADNPPIRAVARISYDYFLNILEPLTTDLGELLMALSWMAILHNNVDHLPLLDTERSNGIQTGWSGDHHRRPTPVLSIAEQLGVPEATIRRRIVGAVRTSHCKRVKGGVIVPDRALHRREFLEIMRKNESSLNRMFNALYRVGALASWSAAL